MTRSSITVLLAAAGLTLAAPITYAERDAKEDAREKAQRDAAAHNTANDVRDAAHDTAAKMDNSTQPVKDAFIHGKIVSAYAVNPHVSAYDIDVNVDNGVAHLTGAVDSDVERDLAVEIARGIDGVTDVRSDLAVKAGSRDAARVAREGRRSVGQTLDDAGTTAAVKTKLLANHNTSGLKINVDTKNGIVTLSGKVGSEAEKDLAEQIARNSADVNTVHNNLSVAKR